MHRPRLRAFSLAELLVVLAIVLLIALLAVPAFRAWYLDARLTAAVNAFVHGIHVARQEAAQRHHPVVLCRSLNGRQCARVPHRDSGWLIFDNHDGDQPPRVDPGEPVLQTITGIPEGSIASNRVHFEFRPYGRRAVNGTLTFCDQRGVAAARLVIVSYTGRPRTVLARNHDGPVTCPA